MPKIYGPREERWSEFWHALIYDTRNEKEVDEPIVFGKELCLFSSDARFLNMKRTNMLASHQFPCDQTMSIRRFGVHVSTDYRRIFEEFFRSVAFEFNVASKSAFEFPASDLVDFETWPIEEDEEAMLYPYSVTSWLDLGKKIALPPRQYFAMHMVSDSEFVKLIKNVESGATPAYFQVKVSIAGYHVRDIL
jgi:hypothetical protein